MFRQLALSSLLVAAASALAQPAAEPPADLILHGGRILTLQETEPVPAPTGLAVRDGRIVRVGDDASVLALRGPATTVRDLAGQVALPGLVDGHCHLYGLGKALAEIDLMDTGSAAACAEAVAAAAVAQPEGWLQGRGWDQNDWPEPGFPRREVLDRAAPGRAVFLRRVDGHAAWCSSEVLRRAGITRDTPDPPGGSILRDGTGEPTGILVDNAVDLVRAMIPPPSAEEVRRRLLLARDHCLARGLTGVHEAGATWNRLQVYREMATADELGLRVYAMLEDDPATLDAGLAAGPFVGTDGRLTVRAVKLYADGALGSRGARLLADYSDDPGNRGLQVTSTAHLRRVCRRAAAAGFQVATHAIGDGANRLVLDLYEEVLGPDLAAARWRVEHAQILDAADLPRFGRLGVIAAMQPVHCTSDMDWADERLGEKRLGGAYAWRSLADTGADLCFGTDFPVERVDPLATLYAARTRQHPDGTPAGGWHPDERLDARTALLAMTAGCAHASFRERQLGRLAPGYLADITVLDTDPVACRPAALLTATVTATIVGGEVQYAR